MNDQQKAKHAAKLLNDLVRQMNTVSAYMQENDLNLENYPENWNSFDEMPGMLENVFVWSENDSAIQEQVGQN